MSKTNRRPDPGEPTREIPIFDADARPARPFPDDPEVLRAMFREAERYIEAARPIVRGLRSLKQPGPMPPSEWDATRLGHELEALSKKLLDLSELDLLSDLKEKDGASWLALGDSSSQPPIAFFNPLRLRPARGDQIRRYARRDRPPGAALRPLARRYRPVERKAHAGRSSHHLGVPDRPRVGVVGPVPRVVADYLSGWSCSSQQAG